MYHVLSSQENSVSASFVKLDLLFLAALGRHCCTWAFSSGGVRASPCGGFSLYGGFSRCGAQALGLRGFSVVAQGSSGRSHRLLEHGLNGCGRLYLWHLHLPGPGIEPCPLHCWVGSYPLDSQEISSAQTGHVRLFLIWFLPTYH